MGATTAHPAGFDNYWDTLDAELAALPARPVIEELPCRSNEHCTVYSLRLTSIGPYRIFGYFTVPKAGGGPFPALLSLPRYGSVNHIPDYNDRLRYVCLQIMHRGQRLADQPYAASYPGLLTDGIDDPDEYVYRGIAADCLRAAEFLLEQPKVDASRVAIQGDDLALIVAARRAGFQTVSASGLMFYRLAEAHKRTSAYPAEEINDELRGQPEREADVHATLALFDPLHHAAAVDAEVILSVGDDAHWLAPLRKALGGRVHEFELTHRGGTDHDALDALLAERLGSQPMVRFIRAF
jgi:cephalosporin-C deacetylase-like acetyl esterase